MRSKVYAAVRVAVAVVAIGAVAGVGLAKERDIDPRAKDGAFVRVVKVVKKAIKSLGDGLTIPTP
jgi:hypothetical protein